jgi:hypothetical protein
VPASFVAATTAHGGATLSGRYLSIGLFNSVAQPDKPFQVLDTAPPGAPAGTTLASAIVTYPVTTTAPTHASPVPTNPALPTNIWYCWRAGTAPINVTDPDVVKATIDLTNYVVTAQINIDHPGLPGTLYISADGTNWVAQPGSPWTPGTGSVATSVGVTTPAQQSTGATFTVSGTLGGYSTPPTLQYADDSGAFQTLPSGASVTATSFSFVHPAMAAGSHTISVRDSAATGTVGTSGTFSVVAPVVQNLSVTTPATQPENGSFAVQGTITGYSAAPTLNYRDDAGNYVALPVGATVTATSFIFTHPGLAAGSHTVSVRDANNIATAVTTGSFTVQAAALPVITITGPSQPVNAGPFTLSGTISNASSVPTLTYADDGGLATPLPSTAVVTTTSFSFLHPGLLAGSHTTVISNGSQSGSLTYSVSAAIPGGASPNFSTVNTTAGSIIDGGSNRYTITSGGQVAINGVVGTAQSAQGLAAAASVSWTQQASTYTYVVDVLNTGSTTLGTFWFSWLPGASYLPTSPLSIIPTAGWAGSLVGPEAGGYSVQWVATNPVAPGTKTTFSFTSNDPPAVIFGNASAFPTTPVATSYVYIAAPFGDAGAAVVAASNQPQTVMPSTSNVVQLAWVNGLIWYQNSSNLWFSETSPAGPWLPPNGTLISPLSTIPTVVLNPAPTNIAPNTAFTITGSLTNYTTAPTLTLADDGGPATALPPGSSVTTSGFSFTHAGLAAGTHSLTVSDGTRSATITYLVSSAAFTTLPSTNALTNTITGLLPNTSYDIEVYATNQVGQGPPSAILKVTTSGVVVALPNVPTGLASAGATQTAVNLLWLAPASGPAPTSYGTRWSPTGLNTWTAGPVVTVTNAQITGLSSGQTYDFEVWSINSAGVSAFTAPITVATTASAAVTATWQPQGATASLSFSTDKLTATAGGSATTGASPQGCVSTISASTGKGSFEVKLTGISNSCSVGLANAQFRLGSRLGSDTNSIGLFVGNIPATTATSSVSGLPLLGMSCMLCYPEGGGFNGDQSAAASTVAAHKKYFTTPRTMEVFPGDWTSSGSAKYLKDKAAAWAKHPDFNGTNSGGVKVIPVMGMLISTIDQGGLTFASVAAGSNDSYFTGILAAWVNAGYKKVLVRLVWEDDYPTTPCGQGATPGSNYPSGSYCPWTFYGKGANNYAEYCAAFIKAWRRAAHVMKVWAAANGLDLTIGWGPTLIHASFIDPKRSYPDSDMSDGLGKLVDAHMPDIYFGNWYGATTQLHTGYDSQPPFTNFARTGTAATKTVFARDYGSEYWLADYWSDSGNYIAPPATPSTTLGWPGGWSLYESMVFCLQHGCSMFIPEFGGLSSWDGSGYISQGALQNGTNVVSGGTGAANMTEMAAFIRPRIAWFQDKTKNGIANGVFLGFAYWQNQSVETLQAAASVFHEFVSDPDAGTRGSGTTTTTTTPGVPPQTIRTANVVALAPSGNLPSADVAGDTVSCCFDLDAKKIWFTTPSMRAAYGATAWNNSATADPGTGVGGVAFNISGALTACFSTEEAGGVAILNAGSSPYSFAGMPANFPPVQGTPQVVTAPGQVTGLASTQANLSITVPASIPTQKGGQAFSVQAAFNYVPDRTKLFYSPPNGSFATTTIDGVNYSPFSTLPPNAPTGNITWDSTGQIATLTFLLNSLTSWTFQVVDNTPGAVVKSAARGFTTSSATGGGGTYTATPSAPSTAVVLSWTAPSTGTGPLTYVIMQSPSGAGTYSIVGTSTTTTASISGLTPGVTYDYVVYAANGAGNGSNSAPVTYTIPGQAPQLTPNAATALLASSPTQTSVSLTWQAAASGPAATGYQVQYKPASASTYINYASTTTQQQQVITGLAAGTAYNFLVIAFNSVGNAPASSVVSATTLTPTTNPSTTGALTTMLTTLSGTGSISGQYIGPGPIKPISDIFTADGVNLGLIGGDYWTPGSAGAAVKTFNQIAIDYWNQGGLVMLSTSMPNPTTGGPSTDLSDLDVQGMLTPGTVTNAALLSNLDQIASGLAALQAAGVSVIFRPFARANDPTLWWGAGNNTKTT